MPRNISIPYFKPGQDITGAPAADLRGRRFVNAVPGGSNENPRINYAEPNGRAIGVTAHDKVAGGYDSYVHVHVAGAVPVEAGDDITAGTDVIAGADGVALPADAANAEGPFIRLGVALTNAAEGGTVNVLLK
ncbi:capsid cement protein [Nesterenkonia rhizosphaerae]|uniref:DUF2190 domain-containing protein n=1 Tax=Nesterenkonia rhizosphaerae TaxID=1348272 RepID=A0ABP9G1Z1_9MICC